MGTQKNRQSRSNNKNHRQSLTRPRKTLQPRQPEAVRTWIATADKSDGYKRNLCSSYDHYTRQHGLTWTKPKYHENAKMPKIPQERKIELIMANSPLKLRTAIAISKDTGLRPVELMRITLRNLDLTNGAIYPETAKHGSPRVLKAQEFRSQLAEQVSSKPKHRTQRKAYSEHGTATPTENGLDTTATRPLRKCKTHL